MNGAIPPLSQYAFMAWYLLKAQKNHWSKEQRSLRVFENGVLKRTF